MSKKIWRSPPTICPQKPGETVIRQPFARYLWTFQTDRICIYPNSLDIWPGFFGQFPPRRLVPKKQMACVRPEVWRIWPLISGAPKLAGAEYDHFFRVKAEYYHKFRVDRTTSIWSKAPSFRASDALFAEYRHPHGISSHYDGPSARFEWSCACRFAGTGTSSSKKSGHLTRKKRTCQKPNCRWGVLIGRRSTPPNLRRT